VKLETPLPHLNRKEKTESGPFLGLFLAALSLWGFLAIADEVTEGDEFAFDRKLLLAMRNQKDLSDPIGPEWLEEMVRDFTALGGVGVLTLVTVFATCFLAMVGKRRAALFVFLAVVPGQILSALAKTVVARPRPELIPHGSYTITSSFPSGHSMMSAVVYLSLGLLVASALPGLRTKIFLVTASILLTLTVGTSRIYLGVHWPSDVLAGWTAGSAWALLCWLVERKLKSTGAVERENQVSPTAKKA
jgi:undecaprenyl-diphosphatase